jgi:hypothetical protein
MVGLYLSNVQEKVTYFIGFGKIVCTINRKVQSLNNLKWSSSCSQAINTSRKSSHFPSMQANHKSIE